MIQHCIIGANRRLANAESSMLQENNPDAACSTAAVPIWRSIDNLEPLSRATLLFQNSGRHRYLGGLTSGVTRYVGKSSITSEQHQLLSSSYVLLILVVSCELSYCCWKSTNVVLLVSGSCPKPSRVRDLLAEDFFSSTRLVVESPLGVCALSHSSGRGQPPPSWRRRRGRCCAFLSHHQDPPLHKCGPHKPRHGMPVGRNACHVWRPAQLSCRARHEA